MSDEKIKGEKADIIEDEAAGLAAEISGEDLEVEEGYEQVDDDFLDKLRQMQKEGRHAHIIFHQNNGKSTSPPMAKIIQDGEKQIEDIKKLRPMKLEDLQKALSYASPDEVVLDPPKPPPPIVAHVNRAKPNRAQRRAMTKRAKKNRKR